MLEGEHPPRAPETGDDLVGDEQHLVLVADFPHPTEVVVLRDDHAARALHGLSDEHRDRVGAFAQNRLLELVGRGNALTYPRRGLVSIGIGRRDVCEARHAWLE